MSLAPAIGLEIADHDQPLAQRHDARMAVAEPQPVGGRHHGPAAARQDIGVLADRELGGLLGRRRQGRQRGLRHVDGARGAVEILADLALLILPDQHLQGGIFGGGTPGPPWRRPAKPPRNSKKGAAIGAAAGPLADFGIAFSTKARRPAPRGPCHAPDRADRQPPRRAGTLQISATGGSGRFCGRAAEPNPAHKSPGREERRPAARLVPGRGSKPEGVNQRR